MGGGEEEGKTTKPTEETTKPERRGVFTADLQTCILGSVAAEDNQETQANGPAANQSRSSEATAQKLTSILLALAAADTH